LTETYVGKRYILLLKFDSEGAFRWLMFSELKKHGEGHIKCNLMFEKAKLFCRRIQKEVGLII
jgi:hypothetical protein